MPENLRLQRRFDEKGDREEENNNKQEIFCHVTTAINTENARFVLAKCKAIILKGFLANTGFYA
jgi:hypothetical protein